jgi:hypothetical protein
MRNAQSVTIAYDGTNPMPPTFCYLKPYYNDVNKSYFRQLADDRLGIVAAGEGAFGKSPEQTNRTLATHVSCHLCGRLVWRAHHSGARDLGNFPSRQADAPSGFSEVW